MKATLVIWTLSTLLHAQVLRPHAIVYKPHELLPRQSCESGYKICGDVCIQLSYSCCPDLAGGCPSDEYCSLGDNGEYGCCPNGESCVGPGGALTSYYTSTYEQTQTQTSYYAPPPTTTPPYSGDYFSWLTYTVTYLNGDRQIASEAIYDPAQGPVPDSVSETFAWTTWVLTHSTGGLFTVTVVSDIPVPLPFTETFIDHTTTRDWAFYQGGYVTNSDELYWTTQTHTFSDGDVTTASIASIIHEAPTFTTFDISDLTPTGAASSTAPVTVTVQPSSNPGTVTVTAASGQETSTGAASSASFSALGVSVHAPGLCGMPYGLIAGLAWSTAMLTFLAMVWL